MPSNVLDTILGDTGAAQSMMSDHIWPESNMEPSKSHALVKGFGGDNYVPIHLRSVSEIGLVCHLFQWFATYFNQMLILT